MAVKPRKPNHSATAHPRLYVDRAPMLVMVGALLASCGFAHLDRAPPFDAFLPVHFSELPADPYDAGYDCRVVAQWQWPEMECKSYDRGIPAR